MRMRMLDAWTSRPCCLRRAPNSLTLPCSGSTWTQRMFVSTSGGIRRRPGVSATAVGLLVGCTAKAGTMQTADTSKSDVDILNTALALEYEGIAAYQVGAESGLLQPPVLKLAVGFQSDHKQHADVLSKTITKLGGTPVMPRKDYDFPKNKLKTQTDVLAFAATLEKGAASAYLGTIPILTERDLARQLASILGDEAMHWAILRQALGQNPVPDAFIS